MKSRDVGLVCGLCMMGSSCLIAHAGVIASDAFSYPDGALTGNNGGTGWTVIWVDSGLDVVSGAAVTNVFNNPPKYATRSFANPAATGDLFFRVRIRTGSVTTADYFGCQMYTGVNNNVLLFGKGVGDTTFGVGNSGLVQSGVTVQPNTEYVLIGAHHIVPGPDPDQLMLWIDPDGSDYLDPATGANSADAMTLESVFFVANSLIIFAGYPGCAFDDIVISDDPAGVGLLAAPPGCVGDIAGPAGLVPDGQVNVDDLNAVLSAWGLNVGIGDPRDLANGDGIVDVDDLNVVLGNWQNCP